MEKTRPKLLMIVITTAVIIAMATTTSLSAATPAFAKINCNADRTVCTGGSGCGTAGCQGGTSPGDVPGGGGGRAVLSESGQVITNNGGFGLNVGSSVGGIGFRLGCDASDCTLVGTPDGRGLHPK
jgi:hypothetical protein